MLLHIKNDKMKRRGLLKTVERGITQSLAGSNFHGMSTVKSESDNDRVIHQMVSSQN